MFTGLVQERGVIAGDPEPSGQGGVRLVIGHSTALGERLGLGASLAVSGVCLTVTEAAPERSVVELHPETLARTTLGGLADGDGVNLEPALRMGDPLGGHWVQGHVDTTIEVLDSEQLTDHRRVAFARPSEEGLAASIVEKGSVTLDGVSLTVAGVAADRFEVALIPHTLAVTTLGERRPGDRVNFEADILAKYIEAALVARGIVPPAEGG